MNSEQDPDLYQLGNIWVDRLVCTCSVLGRGLFLAAGHAERAMKGGLTHQTLNPDKHMNQKRCIKKMFLAYNTAKKGAMPPQEHNR